MEYGWRSCSQRNWAASSVKMKKACLVGGQEQEEAAKVTQRWSKGRESSMCQWEEHTHPLPTQNCLTKDGYGTFWHLLGLISSLDGAPRRRMPTGLTPAQAMVFFSCWLPRTSKYSSRSHLRALNQGWPCHRNLPPALNGSQVISQERGSQTQGFFGFCLAVYYPTASWLPFSRADLACSCSFRSIFILLFLRNKYSSDFPTILLVDVFRKLGKGWQHLVSSSPAEFNPTAVIISLITISLLPCKEEGCKNTIFFLKEDVDLK